MIYENKILSFAYIEGTLSFFFLRNLLLLFSYLVMTDSLGPCGAHQAPLSMGFPRQEYWKFLFQYFQILPSPSQPRDQTHVSWKADSSPLSHEGSPSLEQQRIIQSDQE